MSVYILKDRPIAFIKEINSLALTDLHLGIEYELRSKGIFVPPQKESFLEILKEGKEESGAKNLILLGDIKHKVPRSFAREVEDVKSFLGELSNIFSKVIICKGNHDDRIEDLVENAKVCSARGIKIKNYGFFHGHAWPFSKLWNAETWITGHLQALFEFRKGNERKIERVVIVGKPKVEKGKLKEIIILPAFNKLAGGIVLNKEGNKLSGFLFEKILDFEKSFVYFLDGTEAGKLSEIVKL